MKKSLDEKTGKYEEYERLLENQSEMLLKEIKAKKYYNDAKRDYKDTESVYQKAKQNYEEAEQAYREAEEEFMEFDARYREIEKELERIQAEIDALSLEKSGGGRYYAHNTPRVLYCHHEKWAERFVNNRNILVYCQNLCYYMDG